MKSLTQRHSKYKFYSFRDAMIQVSGYLPWFIQGVNIPWKCMTRGVLTILKYQYATTTKI